MAFSILDVIASFERTADQFMSKEEFKRRLRSRRPQRIKYTIDVKTDNLHIGHAVNLWMIRRLQDMGHKAVIVFTDFTSRIGDKDGRLDTIASYPEKTLRSKIQELSRQACLILRGDKDLLEIRRNSEWYGEMSIQDIMSVFSLVTHARLISRDTFQVRLAEGKELYINEMIYPILQGYDSHRVLADISIIGSDQLFNESIGRLIQEKHKKKPQTLITTRMTPGIDGKTKQSERRDNHISLSHDPRTKFGRVMSIPDALIRDYFRIYTDIPLAELAEIDAVIDRKPREAKIRLAMAIVARYHGDAAAEEERGRFERTISRGNAPDDLPTLVIAVNRMEALDLVVLARPEKSRGDSRRIIQQGGVELNGHKLSRPDQELALKSNDLLQVGKRQWFRIEVATIDGLDTGALRINPCRLEDIPRILARVPAPEVAGILSLPGDGKSSASSPAEALRKAILQPRAGREALFSVFSKENPEQAIGLAHLHWRGTRGEQNFWIEPGKAGPAAVQEAMQALGKHAFAELHLEESLFKTAFAFANVPETLYEAQRSMDQNLLAREDAAGIPGYTPEGWSALQQWRRVSAPWLADTAPAQSRHTKAFKKTVVSQPPPVPGMPGSDKK